MKSSTMLLFVVAACAFSGCMTSPGDGHVVYNDDWECNVTEVECNHWRRSIKWWIAVTPLPTQTYFEDGTPVPPLADDCKTEIRDYYLPLVFSGYTDTPSERITLQKWVPDQHYVNETPAKLIYWDGFMDGRDIPGSWQTIGTVVSDNKYCELPGGWYFWNLSVDFRPTIKGAWEQTFEDEPGVPQKYRFDFRALGADGNVLYCWEKGFYQYMDFDEDPISQYPEHMANDPGKMSIYFDRDGRWPVPLNALGKIVLRTKVTIRPLGGSRRACFAWWVLPALPAPAVRAKRPLTVSFSVGVGDQRDFPG